MLKVLVLLTYDDFFFCSKKEFEKKEKQSTKIPTSKVYSWMVTYR